MQILKIRQNQNNNRQLEFKAALKYPYTNENYKLIWDFCAKYRPKKAKLESNAHYLRKVDICREAGIIFEAFFGENASINVKFGDSPVANKVREKAMKYFSRKGLEGLLYKKENITPSEFDEFAKLGVDPWKWGEFGNYVYNHSGLLDKVPKPKF